MVARLTKSFSVLLLLLLILPAVPVKAQIAPDIFTGSLSLELLPRIPQANSTVTATVENYAIDMSKSTISWSTGDGQQTEGVGTKSFSFTTAAVGVPQTLTVAVTSPTGTRYTESLTLTTGTVDLLVEADTYTPPLYKGRSLFTPQSQVTIAAIPDIRVGGTRVNPELLLYTWEKNDQILQEQSGLSKDTITFLGGITPRPFYVTVTAETRDGTVRTRKRIEIIPKQANVLVYESNPLFGNIFEQAITSRFRFDREEVGLVAVPYFFSAKTRDDSTISYSWIENGKPIQLPTLGSKLIFTNKEKTKSGVSTINVGTSHLNNFLQSAKISFALDVIGDETLANELQTGNVTVF